MRPNNIPALASGTHYDSCYLPVPTYVMVLYILAALGAIYQIRLKPKG